MAEPKPFQITVSDELLSFINQHVSTARIPPGLGLPEQDAWSFGIPPAMISELRDYWEKKFDWRTVEARINSHLKMFTLPITEAGETIAIHFVHHRSEREGAIPLLIQHGWPGNFLEVEPIIESLTSPKDIGQQAFHVVAPSLPGFAFSEGPKGGDFLMSNIAAVDHKLMVALEYDAYVAQGGDLGTMVVEYMGMDYPESCVAVHVNGVFTGPPTWWRYLFHLMYLIIWAIWNRNRKDSQFGRLRWWLGEESGYSAIQGTKPQTLSYGLVDSPIGMLAWIREKVQFLVDDDYEWEAGDIITWTMVCLVWQSL
jgi:pimeloyl-ACP methyl ester carboxylesterase